MPNADALVKGNEVRIGGVRVGVVKGWSRSSSENGNVAAELDAEASTRTSNRCRSTRR